MDRINRLERRRNKIVAAEPDLLRELCELCQWQR
jgi:hypothetical protein